ncbi:MAG: hypothetical protein N3I35_09900 [Clostridia bacterium]|nr:hypothetical protein [Clostridia bacterium]
MSRKNLLLQRLDDIGKSLELTNQALALLGLGSVGIETERIDDYSDLDFFVIAKQGCKQRLLDNLDWLSHVNNLTYSFKNTDNGYKIMFEDGIYGEFAVFEERELEGIPYSEGRIVWKYSSYNNNDIARPSKIIPEVKNHSIDFALNEALTNLYVGLCRYARGEKLSALRLIENHAVNQLTSIVHLIEIKTESYADKFCNNRRIEKQYPGFSKHLGKMLQGYEKSPQSAIYILEYLEDLYPVNKELSNAIKNLAFQLASKMPKEEAE